MALQTFSNGESLSTVRTKINNAILEAEKSIVKPLDYTAGADAASGNVTSQTTNSITDNTKAFSTDQWAGYGVRLATSTGEVDYTRVQSNTATQLVFDDNHAGYTYASYRILPTFDITSINSITSVNINANDCAIILPDLDTTEERKFVSVYLEQSNNNGKRAAIICRGTQRQRGMKYGFLNYKYEGVTFWSHYLSVRHWDILALENIKRYTGAEVTTNTAVTSTTYTPAIPFGNATLSTSRRFESRNVSGAFWFKYMSITPLEMVVNGSLLLSRTGGGTTNIEIAVRIKRFNGGATVDTTQRCVVRFSGDASQTVSPDVKFTLEPYDEVTVIIKRDAGTVTLEAGSSITIKEL